MNSVMSSRIIIIYLLMALKKVTELLLLLSIETTPNVFDYLMQQARKEFSNLYAWKQMSPLSISGEKNFHSSIA